MPNLENLRKQAKQFLRWHRDRYYPVAAEIRYGLPKFRHLTDREVLERPFKLGDAQELIARRHGFDSWQALKTGIAAMPKTDSATQRAKLIAAEPELFVTDIKAATDFFTTKLGFKVVFLYGEPPFYGQVKRDGTALNLRHVDRPVIDGALRDQEELLSAAITVDDVKALYLEYQAASVVFFQPLKKQPWGARNFIVKDPDGNLVLFAGSDE